MVMLCFNDGYYFLQVIEEMRWMQISTGEFMTNREGAGLN